MIRPDDEAQCPACGIFHDPDAYCDKKLPPDRLRLCIIEALIDNDVADVEHYTQEWLAAKKKDE